MSLELAFSIKMFSALFAIMNPAANVPVFLSLTRGESDAERRRVATTALIAVSIGCVVAAVAGSSILGIFGVSIDDFRLAGGLLVLLIALSTLSAPFIGHYLSPRMTAITQRLMGMILAAIAVDMMMTSLRASFSGLT